MSDPVAAKSSWLCAYMSNHPDALVAYVSHFLKERNVTIATMDAITSNDMTFTYSVRGSKSKKHVVIPFDPPLLGYEEVKPRLLEMKVNAEVAMGMAKNPVITGFSAPWGRLIKGPTPLQFVLIYATFAPPGTYGEIIRNFTGPLAVKVSWAILISTHVVESSYMLWLCLKHKTGFFDSFLWTLFTVMFGYPIWSHFRRLVHKARIDSIMKGA